jgi:nanoRNase/pAp phosphatase (c-di-AMP/oligoRNAs hydrolase)
MDLTPKQQTSEAIRQAESILILTGQNPTIDQVTAVMSLATILRKFGKKVSAIVSDQTPQQLNFLDLTTLDKSLTGLRDFILKLDVSKSEVDKLRYEIIDTKLEIFITPAKGGFAPSDLTFDYGDFQYDLAIVLGVPTRNKIDRIYVEHQGIFNAIPLVNIDFHRSNENYGAINLIEPNASSLCEILVATSESLQSGMLDADIATIMLAGLMSSTDRFTASHTTSKSLTVAAQLMAAGARQQAVVKALYRTNEREYRPANNPRADQPRRDNPPYRPAAGQINQNSQNAQSSSFSAQVVPETRKTETLNSNANNTSTDNDKYGQSAVTIEKITSVKPLDRNNDSGSFERSAETIGPVAHVEDNNHEPIIDPAHMELSHREEASEENLEVADFAAAAQELQARLNRELAPGSDRQ